MDDASKSTRALINIRTTLLADLTMSKKQDSECVPLVADESGDCDDDDDCDDELSIPFQRNKAANREPRPALHEAVELTNTPNKTVGRKKMFQKTIEWTKLFTGFGTESCIRLVDVDEDGRDDIIFGTTGNEFPGGTIASEEEMKRRCSQAGERYPCVGRLVALRGHDGVELWRLRVFGTPFEINCNNIDINQDGKLDCIAAGRLGTAVAFDPRRGKVFWTIDTSIVHFAWNFYNPLIMPDFTLDGVPEVLFSHGGDNQFVAKEHKRIEGRLVLVDGSSGRSLGRYLNMSRYKETYNSPVLHTTKDGSQYVLYGDGGETVAGDFLGISLPDLYRYVKNLPRYAAVPNTQGSYTSWKNKVHLLKNGVFAIYRSTLKGVMTTPTLVDMNNDGVRDIVMSAYDGTMRLYDGETLDIIWTSKFDDGLESYSSLAPGYFNDDDHLDFMLILNKGTFPTYKYSLKIVLDGTNGKVLWQMNATLYAQTSILVARTTEKHRDTFVFRAQGVIDAGSQVRKKRRLQRVSNTKDGTNNTKPVDSNTKDGTNNTKPVDSNAKDGTNNTKPFDSTGVYSVNNSNTNTGHGNNVTTSTTLVGSGNVYNSNYNHKDSGSESNTTNTNFVVGGNVYNSSYNHTEVNGSQNVTGNTKRVGSGKLYNTSYNHTGNTGSQNVTTNTKFMGSENVYNAMYNHTEDSDRLNAKTNTENVGSGNVYNSSYNPNEDNSSQNITAKTKLISGNVYNASFKPTEDNGSQDVTSNTKLTNNSDIYKVNSNITEERGNSKVATSTKVVDNPNSKGSYKHTTDSGNDNAFTVSPSSITSTTANSSSSASKTEEKTSFHYPNCLDDMRMYTTHFLLLDRSNVHSPNIVLSVPSLKIYFNLTEYEQLMRKIMNSPRRKRFMDTGETGPFCGVLRNAETTTGALGDVDGDGELDMIAIVDSQGLINGEIIHKLRIIKVNVADAVRTRGRLHAALYVSEEMQSTRGIKPIENIKLCPVKEQPWTQYLGKRGNGIYRRLN